jgi:hypothetical protein
MEIIGVVLVFPPYYIKITTKSGVETGRATR